MLADGIDPIGAKNQAKTQALIKGRTFESVALCWHTEMSAKWAPDYSKTVMSRLKTHLFPLIGARAIVDLDTHDLMQPLEAIKKRGTIDVALRVQNYLQNIMREAKRLRLITVNPAYDLEGSIKASRVVHRPALYLSRLPDTPLGQPGAAGAPRRYPAEQSADTGTAENPGVGSPDCPP